MKKLFLALLVLSSMFTCYGQPEDLTFIRGLNIGESPAGLGIAYEHFLDNGFSGIAGVGINKIGAVGGFSLRKYSKNSYQNSIYYNLSFELSSGTGDGFYSSNGSNEIFPSFSFVPGYTFKISNDGKWNGNVGLGLSYHFKHELLEEMYSIKDGRGMIWLTGVFTLSYRIY